MLRFLTCSLLASALAISADVVVEDYENAGDQDMFHWTGIGEAINKVAPTAYVSYWWFYDDSLNGGKSIMEPKLLKGDQVSFGMCQKTPGAGYNNTKGWHQKWTFDGNAGAWEFPYLGLGFDYLANDATVDMTKLTAISLYAKGTPGKKIEFTIGTSLLKTSFKGDIILTEGWEKHTILPSTFAPAKSLLTWDEAKTKAKGTTIHANGKDGEYIEFWLDDIVFEGMDIETFVAGLSAPVKNPLSKTSCTKEFSINTSGTTPSITFKLKSEENVNLSILDLNGRYIATLADGIFSSGPHSITVDKSIVSTGAYVVNMTRGNSQSAGLLTIK